MKIPKITLRRRPRRPLQAHVKPGTVITASDGTKYLTSGRLGETLLRVRPKVKGKAARRAEKRRRRELREMKL